MHAILDFVFRMIQLPEADWPGHRYETRKMLLGFISFAVALGGLGAVLAFVVWYVAQL